MFRFIGRVEFSLGLGKGELGEEFIHSCRSAGKIVFVHCDAGMDRSAMVVIAYLTWRRGWGREEALEFVQRKRGVVRVSLVFMELLGEWGGAMGAGH